MRTFYKLFICLTISLTLGCGGEVYYTDLNGGYYLSADDIREDMSLGYQDGEDGIGVIDATVFAISQNDSFILVKQHPANFPDKPDKGLVNYYIIPLKTKLNKASYKNFYGLFDLSGFEEKKKVLKIQDLEFTIVFEDLE